MKIIVRLLVTAVALAVAAYVLPGVHVAGENAYITLAITAVILAFCNAFIRPLLQAISIPITILTLGLFAFVVNGLVLELAALLSNNLFDAGFVITNLGAAVGASLIVSIVSLVLNKLLGTDKK